VVPKEAVVVLRAAAVGPKEAVVVLRAAAVVPKVVLRAVDIVARTTVRTPSPTIDLLHYSQGTDCNRVDLIGWTGRVVKVYSHLAPLVS
jgi:hypothetical protein